MKDFKTNIRTNVKQAQEIWLEVVIKKHLRLDLDVQKDSWASLYQIKLMTHTGRNDRGA